MHKNIIWTTDKEGDNIGRILVIEFSEQDKPVFDDIVLLLKHSPSFANFCLKDESVLSFLDLEIYPDRRKVYIGFQEIHLTAKEYDLLCLLTANRGRVLTYIQIYQRIWGEEALGNEANSVLMAILQEEKIYWKNFLKRLDVKQAANCQMKGCLGNQH